MPTTRRTSPARDVEVVAAQLHATTLHLLRRLRVEDEARGLTAPRLSALSILDASGPMRIGEMAEAERVEPPSMTRLVDKMERDGLVERRPDAHDRRAIQVRLTPAGSRTLQRGRTARVATLTELLAGLAEDEHDALAVGIGALHRHATATGLGDR